MKCTECSHIVKPIVAVDIDGTLADYHAHFRRFASAFHDQWMPANWNGEGDWEDYLGLSREKYREAKLAYRQGGWKRMMPMFLGAEMMMWQLQKWGMEVWITTTRPYNRLDSVDPDTQEWLRRNSIKFDHLLYDEHKYGHLARIVQPERVLAVLDDLPTQLAEADSAFGQGTGVLRYNAHNRMEDHKPTVRTYQEFLDIVEDRAYQWRAQYGS